MTVPSLPLPPPPLPSLQSSHMRDFTKATVMTVIMLGAYACADEVMAPKSDLTRINAQPASAQGDGFRILGATYNGFQANGSNFFLGNRAAANCTRVGFDVRRVSDGQIRTSGDVCAFGSNIMSNETPGDYELRMGTRDANGNLTVLRTEPFTVTTGVIVQVPFDLTNVIALVHATVTVNGGVPPSNVYRVNLVSSPDGGSLHVQQVPEGQMVMRLWVTPGVAGTLLFRHDAGNSTLETFTFAPPTAGQMVNTLTNSSGTSFQGNVNVVDATGSVLLKVPTYNGQLAGGFDAPLTGTPRPAAASNCDGITFALVRLSDNVQTLSRTLCQLESDNTLPGQLPGNYSVQLITASPTTLVKQMPVTVSTGQSSPLQFVLEDVLGQVAGTITVNGAAPSPSILQQCLTTAPDGPTCARNTAAGGYKLWTRPGDGQFVVRQNSTILGTYTFTGVAGQTATVNPAINTGSVIVRAATYLGQPAGGSSGTVAAQNCSGITVQVIRASDGLVAQSRNLCSLGFDQPINPALAGTYRILYRLAPSNFVVKETSIDLVAGQTRSVPVVLDDVVGQMTGTVIVNGSPASTFTQMCVFDVPDGGCSAVSAQGTFRLWSNNGNGRLDVRASSGVGLGGFTYRGAAGQTVAMGNLVTGNFNGTTPAGTNVLVQPHDQSATSYITSTIGLTFASVSAGGLTNAVQSLTAPSGVPQSLVLGTPPVNFTLTTSATFSGNVTVCMNYTGTTFAEVNGLQLFQRNSDGVWSTITTSHDQTNRMVCGVTTSLGLFMVGSGTLNRPPTITQAPGGSGVEGSVATVSVAAMDPDGDALTYKWDLGADGSVDETTATPSAQFAFADNGSYAIRVTAFDPGGASVTADGTIAITNANPTVTSVTTPLNPTAINAPLNLTASFTDPGSSDTHTATVSWDLGLAPVPVTVNGATRTVSASRSFATPGVYVVTLTVTDKDGGSATMTSSQYVVVYDPNGGFVTGGGWIMSQPGAYFPDATLTGKANFGFVAKYKKGQTIPDGETEFYFHAGDMKLKSTAYAWLVVSGSKAQYRGSGTINGSGTYTFNLTVIDGSPDRIRMKIWDATGQIVYDNQTGAADTADPVTAIGGGSIVIHKP
jgi:hypothetical protein